MKKTFIIVLLLLTLFGCNKNESSDRLNLFSNGLLAVEIDGKWGYVNNKGEIIIQALYDQAASFYDDKAVVLINKKMQLIDDKGNNLLSKSYDELYRDISTNRIIYKNDGKWGLMNSKGEIITDALYDYFSFFSDGLAMVGAGGKYGFMDTSGGLIVSLTYDDAYDFSNGLAAVMKDDLWGFIDTDGDVYINLTFSDVYSFDDHGNAKVQSAQDGTWGLINKESKLLVLQAFNEIYGQGPLYAVKLNQDYMLYKEDGTRFNNIDYSKVWNLDGYFANLEINGEDLNIWFNENGTVFKSVNWEQSNYSYFNTGSETIPFFTVEDEKFIEIYFQDFSYRFEGSFVFPMIEDKQFIIVKNNKYGILDKDKNIVIEFLYDFLYKTDDGYFIFKINDKYGFMDSKYRTIVTATYTNFNINVNITW